MKHDLIVTFKRSDDGAGLLGLLAIAFIVLKLCGVIAWSWWWVLAPVWAPIALLVAFALLCGLGYLGLSMWSSYQAEKRRKARVGLTK